ncbi:MAG: methyltransferase [Candidatus Thiodiazotropha sp. (ex Lucinoma kastoroae)]|nr:methyltransferase [Candidatus Thiodiazotropha sp. (ex Lucinoma kastoroae)]
MLKKLEHAPIDFDQLQNTQGKTVKRYNKQPQPFEIREQGSLRWIRFSDGSIQSVMLLQEPAYPMLDYIQGLLCSLLYTQQPSSLLNLGLGAGSIERFVLSQLPKIKLVSVEIDPNMVSFCRDYFNLPNSYPVVLSSAEHFLDTNQKSFDIIVCDIYIKRNTENPLLTTSFYQDIASILNQGGVLAINCLPASESEIVDLLLKIRSVFPWIVMFDVPSLQNIVLFCSLSAAPEISTLTTRAEKLYQSSGLNLLPICKRLIWLPKNNQHRCGVEK